MNYPHLWQLAIGLTLATFLLFGCGSPPSATSTPQPPPAKSAAVEPVAAMLATAASPLPSRATPGPFDPLFESVPRTVDAVDVQDETAYLNVGPILATLNVSDRRTPRLLGAVKLPVETIADIAVSNGYAYVATESGLRIVDVSNPAHPLEVGAYVPPLITGDRNLQGVTGVEVGQAAGQIYAYVAAQDAGLRVVNVSNPARPVEVGAFVPTEGGVGDVVIANNQAYLVNNEGVQIVDISDPTRPQATSFLPIPYLDYSGVVNAIAIPTDQAGSPYIYAAAGSCQNWGNDRFCGGMLRVIDVARPTGPQISLPLGFSGVSTKIAVSHQHAYLLTSDGLRVVDVSDPTHPQDKTVLPRTWAKDITIAGDTLYVAVEICPGQCGPGGSRDGSLHIFDLSDPAAPAPVSLWQPPGRAAVNPIEEPTVEPDLEMLVIQQVASEVCPVNNPGGEPTFADSGTVYSFSCPVAAGHGIGARITRFPGQTEAQVAFKQNHDLSQEFHGCPAFEEQYDERTEPNQLPMRHRNHSWQVDRWLVEASAFDDTGLALVGVLAVSEQIYQAAIAYGLIAGC